MMDYYSSIVQRDLNEISKVPLQWFNLNGKHILVTGANGMIATYLIYTLMFQVQKGMINVKVIALSRNVQRAKELFGAFWNDSHFVFLEQDICAPIQYKGRVDYIFHFAGNASPYYIEHDPVGIMKSNLVGTMNVLELARWQEVQKVVFASTREVYGENDKVESLSEQSFGKLDCLENRACYPESKRAAETLCKSYYLQYGVPFNAVRIAHAYGPGMKLENDGRVMADLLSNVVHGQDIVLKSTGEALRAFCYVTDVVVGLFQILFYGNNAEAYNLANETEEVSIRNLAELLVSLYPNKNLTIQFCIPETNVSSYCQYRRVGLDVRKIKNIGWCPLVSLRDGLKRTLDSML